MDWSKIRQLVASRDRWTCQCCGVSIIDIQIASASYLAECGQNEWLKWLTARRLSLDFYQIDHIIPEVDGGTRDPENLRLLCTPCHKRRTANTRAARRLRMEEIPLTPPPVERRVWSIEYQETAIMDMVNKFVN